MRDPSVIHPDRVHKGFVIATQSCSCGPENGSALDPGFLEGAAPAALFFTGDMQGSVLASWRAPRLRRRSLQVTCGASSCCVVVHPWSTLSNHAR
jgi:hypothetical protein